MLNRKWMFEEFLQEDLLELAAQLDQCFETINMMILWQAMNSIDDDNLDIREYTVDFFSSNFGTGTGEALADMLLGPQEANEPPV